MRASVERGTERHPVVCRLRPWGSYWRCHPSIPIQEASYGYRYTSSRDGLGATRGTSLCSGFRPLLSRRFKSVIASLCFCAFLPFLTGLFYSLSCFFQGSTRLFFGLLR